MVLGKEEKLEKELMKIQGKNGLVCCGTLGVLAIATLTFYSGMLNSIINFIGNKIGVESDNSALSLSHFSKFENESIIVGSPNDGDIPQSGEDNYFFQ